MAFIVSTSQFLTLRTVPLTRTISVPLVLYILAASFDVIITVGILSACVTLKPGKAFASLMAFLVIYPFSTFISPMIGLISVISCRTRMYRYHAKFNSLSIFSSSVLLLIAVFYDLDPNISRSNLLTYFALAIIVNKLAIGLLLPIQIAHFLNPKYLKNQEYLKEMFGKNFSREKDLVVSRSVLH